jgi:dihydropyrimidinase
VTPPEVTAVTGGTVVTPDGQRRADLLITGGTITAVGPAGTSPAAPATGPRIDATGCYVLPGGVDPHAHLMAGVQPATAAAARGGTTTALSFTNPDPGERDLDCLRRRVAQVTGGGAVIDVGLHAMLYDPDRATEAELAAARRAGAAAVKVFLAYPELGIMCSERRLFELMTAARRVGLLVQVHCENGPLIEALEAEAAADQPAHRHRGARVFADTRPPEVEHEAVAAALAIAALAGAPCYLVHLSTAAAVEQVRLARRRPRPPVFAEVCPHHLLLDDRRYAGPDPGRYLVAPPLRAAEDAEALWTAVADGTIDAVGSDHCQARSAVPAAILAPGEEYEYGIAGIGARVPLLLSEGLARGIPITRLSQLLAEHPARIFRHFPQKGALRPGSDADLLVYDPAGETVLGADAFDDGTGPSVYAGLRLRGRIRDVLLRGRPVVTGGWPAAGPAHGRYQPAARLGDGGPAGGG